jgi:hypothetical protein
MRILILDDDQTRHDAFAQKYAGHELTHVYNFAEATAALSANEPYDLASFDHDLADFQPETKPDGSAGMREYTGYDVVMFLVSNLPEDRWPAKAIIHSWNAPRARQMAEVLRDRGISVMYKPFIVE